jgi:hypothetical protein
MVAAESTSAIVAVAVTAAAAASCVAVAAGVRLWVWGKAYAFSHVRPSFASHVLLHTLAGCLTCLLARGLLPGSCMRIGVGASEMVLEGWYEKWRCSRPLRVFRIYFA